MTFDSEDLCEGATAAILGFTSTQMWNPAAKKFELESYGYNLVSSTLTAFSANSALLAGDPGATSSAEAGCSARVKVKEDEPYYGQAEATSSITTKFGMDRPTVE